MYETDKTKKDRYNKHKIHIDTEYYKTHKLSSANYERKKNVISHEISFSCARIFLF